jgi:vancomycin resistance protein YoaR
MLQHHPSQRTLRRGLTLLAGAVLVTLLVPAGWSAPAFAAQPAQAPGPNANTQYFPATSHQVSGALLDFYGRAGGADRFGAPLTEQYQDGAQVYQIFERGALQYNPQSGAVTVRALGQELVAGRAADAPVSVGAKGPDGLFVMETGHTVGRVFAPYWQKAGTWDRFGKPISEQLVEGDRAVQYFEFGKLTADPAAPNGVREQLLDSVRAAGSPFAPAAGATDATALFIAATGHSIAGGFREVYQALGADASFGAPLTDEVLENGLMVQYFSAGKLSWSGARPAGHQVQVEAVGKDWMATHSVPAAALQTVAAPVATPTATPALQGGVKVPDGWTLVAEGQTTYKGSSAARTKNIVLAAKKLDGVTVPAGGVFSFNRSLGDDTEKAGFVKALIIYNGRTIEGIGGGICQVASTVFRAAFNSGFDIIERHPHSYRVSWYEPPVGFDATVFSDEGVDLRWRNNLPAPILMRTAIDNKAGTVTVSIYSAAQQPFTVSFDGPYTTNRKPHGAALYENDPTLPAGKVVQVEHAKDGLDVTVYRVITDKATGKVLRKDKFFSRYVPWRDVYKRGTGKSTTTNPEGSGVTVQKP